MHDIGISQDADTSLRRQEAKDHFYTVGNRWHFSGATVATVLALASPLVLIFKPDLGPLLGAVAGVWIFFARLVFEPLRQQFQFKGAVAQELFDCDVLGLNWNDALVSQLSEEEIRNASKSFKSAESARRHKGWYPTDTQVKWPQSVIICQRSNAVWGRRQHHAYGTFLVILAAGWAIIGIIIAMVDKSSLTQYLTTIALPSLPALLDATELSKRQMQASSRRRRLEDKTNALFDNVMATHGDLRELQDQIFELRRDAPSVANWFYKVLARGYEVDMRFAAAEKAGKK
jgi:SMODS-associating 4TM effector domain